MKRPKLGDAMFDENDKFENLFAAINVFPKLGYAMFHEDDIFNLPSFDMQIYYDESMPPIYDDYCDDMYDLKNNDNHETCHLNLNFQSHDSYFVEFAPTTIQEKKFTYVESNKNSMLYVMVILLNSFMMLLKIIIREEHMLVGIAIISSFLSMCLKFRSYACFAFLC